MGTSGLLLILPTFDISFLEGRIILEVSVSVFLCPINERAEGTRCPQLHSRPVFPEEQWCSSSQLSLRPTEKGGTALGSLSPPH